MDITDYAELKLFFEAFQVESDRACGILAGVLLDSLLETLLKAVMLPYTPKEIFSGSGVLATFAGKTDMAYYLGHIAKDEYNELNIIRKIRNDFGHNITRDLSFSTPTIADKTRNLQFSQALVDSSNSITRPISEEEIKAITEQPRKRFEISSGILTHLLNERIKKAQQPTSPEGFTDIVARMLALQKKNSTG